MQPCLSVAQRAGWLLLTAGSLAVAAPPEAVEESAAKLLVRDAACAAGAWGGKINGSGGGGTCFAYCAVEVAEAVERAVGEVGG